MPPPPPDRAKSQDLHVHVVHAAHIWKVKQSYFRFASLQYIASVFLYLKMPCISQSECHVPPLQPLPNSHLHMNPLHSTEPDNWTNLILSIHYILAGKVDLIKISKCRGARD